MSKSALEKHEGIRNDPIRRDALRTISAALQSPHIERLVAGFANLHNPNLRMKDCVQEIRSLLDEGRGDEAADLFVSEHKAWMRPAADDRGPLYVDFCNKFVPDLGEGMWKGRCEAARANPAACKKEFNTL